MKLNQELLNKIKEEIGIDFFSKEKSKVSKINWKWDNLMCAERLFLLPEICRQYSEKIIKCDECDGSGQREINVDGMDCPTTCIFCEGKGYQE